jgi:histidinol dehydrogenase
MKTIINPNKNDWSELIKRPTKSIESLDKIVKQVFEEIQYKGDEAIQKYTHLYDKVELKDITVKADVISAAKNSISEKLKNAICLAKENIEKFHVSQKEEKKIIETVPGVQCWRESRAIEKVGIYIPGGSAPLFSTVLMLGVPAKIAGCKEIVLCTPPDKNGNINPAILFAAELVGVTKVVAVGGIQAIGGLTFGTQSIPKVDKILGPGNQFVTAAKQMAQNYGVAIDMPAGPSEVLVITDQTSTPAFVAADLLSQAEHGPDSQVILLSTDENVVIKIIEEVQIQLEELPRKEITAKALENSRFIVLSTLDEGIEFSNLYAPEHLILATEKANQLIDKIQNAGSVFIGNYSCESAGDYASGTNHTLPTNGYARNYSGVSLDTFYKKITFQQLSKEGLNAIGWAIEQMAEAEGLQAHKNAVSIRLRNKLLVNNE